MKRLSALLLALLLLTALAGCGKNNNSSNPASDLPQELPADEMPQEEPETPQETDPLHPEIRDEHISMQLDVAQESFSNDELIEVFVTLENISSNELILVRGSGSNTVPDALQIELDGLLPMYKPAMMTMDYAIINMEPGEILTYQCTFAPYRAEHEYYLLEPDSGLDFFEEGDFTIAEPGTVNGTVRLSYTPLEEEDDSQMLYNIPDEAELQTLEVSFHIVID